MASFSPVEQARLEKDQAAEELLTVLAAKHVHLFPGKARGEDQPVEGVIGAIPGEDGFDGPFQ